MNVSIALVVRRLAPMLLALALWLAAIATASAATLPPAPVPGESFDAGNLHVDRYGAGDKTLVLIPGLGSGPWAWYGTIAKFSPAYTIYVLTLPGFDGRPATSRVPLFTAFADDFWAMLADRKISMPIVVGHSLGGTLAFLLAEQHPERLRAIVAVDGLPVFPLIASKTPAERAAIADQAAGSYANLSATQALAYEKNFMQTIGTRESSLVEPTALLEAKSDPKAVAAWLKEDLTTDLRPDLGKITIPVLEIMPYDPEFQGKMGLTQAQALAFYQSLLAGTPNVKVEAVAPSRHFAMLDQPDAVYAALGAFFATLK